VVVQALLPLELEMGIKSNDGAELVRLLKSARELKKQQDRAEKSKWSKVSTPHLHTNTCETAQPVCPYLRVDPRTSPSSCPLP
jgi:very-short-patch-repair endonuclease